MRKYSYLQTFLKEVWNIYYKDYLIVVGIILSAGVGVRFFNLPEFLVGVSVFIPFMSALFFFSASSMMPSTNADSDRFGWKYLQSIPLSKSEILVGLIIQNLFVGSVFLVWLISFLPQVKLFLDKTNNIDLNIVAFLFVSYFPIMTIISFKSVKRQIVYPRTQYSKSDIRLGKLHFLQFILALITFCFYVIWFLEANDPFNNFVYSPALKTYLIAVINIIFSWWIILPTTILAIYSYFSTLKAWQNDSYGYNKPRTWEPKRDFAIIGSCVVLLTFAVFTNDLKTPNHFKDGSFQNSVYKKDWSKIKTFAASSGEINKRNIYGLTPIQVAVINNDFEAYKFLFEHGADVALTVQGTKLSDYEGQDLIRLAIGSKSEDIIGHLLKNKFAVDRVVSKRLNTPLHMAASKCNAKMVDILISNGAHINAKNVSGNTPLHFAASKKCFGVVTALLDAGADPKIKNLKSKLALDLIEKNKYSQDLTYYLEKKTRAPASVRR